MQVGKEDLSSLLRVTNTSVTCCFQLLQPLKLKPDSAETVLSLPGLPDSDNAESSSASLLRIIFSN